MEDSKGRALVRSKQEISDSPNKLHKEDHFLAFLGISCTGGEGKALTSDGFSGTRTWDEGLSLVRKNDTQAEIKKQG